jgi:hypothetical protein
MRFTNVKRFRWVSEAAQSHKPNKMSPSEDLFCTITDLEWCMNEAILRNIESLLQQGADFNLSFYDGRQEEWTTLDHLTRCTCENTNDVLEVDIDHTFHDYLEKILQLFLQYRGLDAFREDELDGDWPYDCQTCQEIVREIILKPLRAQKWLNFCSSGTVTQVFRQSLLFDKHLLYLIRDFSDG